MRKLLTVLIVISSVVGSLGCTPRIKVIANPTARDQGIRYYRPKPYLLVTSGTTQVTKGEDSSTTTIVPDAQYVNIQLQYLPDFAEEYALDVRTGFGSANVGITLENGWNLITVNQDLDSQTDENVKAAAELIGSIGKIAGGAGLSANKDSTSGPSFEVKASNVPLGYYESVIGRDSCGRKKLYGFRYVGFMPYQSCPISMSGYECGDCQSNEIYGIVFEKGVMVFQPLNVIRNKVVPDDIVEAPSPQAPTSTVQRTLTYNLPDKDKPTGTIVVQDKFPVIQESNGTVSIGVPKLIGN